MGDDNDSDLENSRVLKRSSLGLNQERKSVIQMQSEKYMLKNKKMPVKSKIKCSANVKQPTS